MKPFIRNTMFTVVLALTAGSMAIAQSSNNQFDQWYRAKYGRPSPAAEARMAEEQANTAYREVSTPQSAAPANAWFEGWYRSKYGRPSPSEQARIDTEMASTAYREVPSAQTKMSTNTWYDGWYRAKFGRPSPLEQMRLKDGTH